MSEKDNNFYKNYILIAANETSRIENQPSDLYSYAVFTGKWDLEVSNRDSLWYLHDNSVSNVSDCIVTSTTLGIIIYGYKPFNRTTEINTNTTLPYINGCSTTQLLPAIRKGDPTFQLLKIPPYSKEQAHHIHSTARIVYVYSGSGKSIIGQAGNSTEVPLNEGDTLILDKMVPHHFETKDSTLIVLPLHIFSSIGKGEFDHPMYSGTHEV